MTQANINTFQAQETASAFSKFLEGKYTEQHLKDYSPEQFTAATIALAKSINIFNNLSKTYQAVGKELEGSGVGEEAALKAATAGFIFTSEFSKFSKLHKTNHKVFSIEGKKGKYKTFTTLSAEKDSGLSKIITQQEDHYLGLSATPFSDYSSEGFNSEGEAYFLEGTVAKGQASEVNIKGINSAQKQAYKANKALELATEIFSKIEQQAALINKSGKEATQKHISRQIETGKIQPDQAILDFQELSDSQIKVFLEGSKFITENKQAFIQYKADSRGRQYPVGSFNHYNTGVLVLLLDIPSKAEEKLEDLGISKEKAVKAVKDFSEGKASALNIFFNRKVASLAEKTLVQTSFSFSALAAAIYFSSK